MATPCVTGLTSPASSSTLPPAQARIEKLRGDLTELQKQKEASVLKDAPLRVRGCGAVVAQCCRARGPFAPGSVPLPFPVLASTRSTKPPLPPSSLTTTTTTPSTPFPQAAVDAAQAAHEKAATDLSAAQAARAKKELALDNWRAKLKHFEREAREVQNDLAAMKGDRKDYESDVSEAAPTAVAGAVTRTHIVHTPGAPAHTCRCNACE
jgi:hypothetical protein